MSRIDDIRSTWGGNDMPTSYYAGVHAPVDIAFLLSEVDRLKAVYVECYGVAENNVSALKGMEAEAWALQVDIEASLQRIYKQRRKLRKGLR